MESEPEGLTGVARGEGEADTVSTFADPTADLEETEAEGIELVGGRVG